MHGECNRIADLTCCIFLDRYPVKPRPDKKTIRPLDKKLNNFFS